ncbi:hypothetical protein HMPREF1090_03545 [[Clostridium] clostridioforme 90A8]|uniref:Uncharacterized protein n=1 Tax=[Clostridium] clostridioforme 90A8 TaxID=999408 RepID=A0A0E2H8J6_9FIRM|nr:hypothetical protein HMPREF1090_03545 [[Clostridium] clostridioforme 90A8]
MFLLERKESYAMPNILGNCSQPVYTYRWKAIAKSETERPLLDMIKDMDVTTHRIVSNQPD